MSLDISGTYTTSWQQPDSSFTLGPVIVVNATNIAVTVDGYSITDPVFAGTVVTWQYASGNQSSGALSFYDNNGTNGFVGSYVEGSGKLPQTNNLFGTSTKPALDLSAWNATYNTFNLEDGHSTKEGTLSVASPTVIHNGATIKNYQYTGITSGTTSIEQLAWFMPDGNPENVVLQFSKDQKSGDLTFYGNKWTTGDQPADVNFTGTTASTPPSNQTITIALAAISVSNQQQNVTTEVEVDVAVDVSVAVDVAVVVAVVGSEDEFDGQLSPGSQLTGSIGSDKAAADQLAETSERLAATARLHR